MSIKLPTIAKIIAYGRQEWIGYFLHWQTNTFSDVNQAMKATLELVMVQSNKLQNATVSLLYDYDY